MAIIAYRNIYIDFPLAIWAQAEPSERFLNDIHMNFLWLYWDMGIHTATEVPQQCIKAWKDMNASWIVRCLCDADLPTLGNNVLLNLRERLAPRCFSNILRIFLLSRHGGVWADSTALPLRTLDSWLDFNADVGAFQRPRGGMSSWFLWCGSLRGRFWFQTLLQRILQFLEGLIAEDKAVPTFWIQDMLKEHLQLFKVDKLRVWPAEMPHFFASYSLAWLQRCKSVWQAEKFVDCPLFKLDHRKPWSAFSWCPAVAEVNGSVAKLARCAELITTSCPAPGSQVFESKGQVKVRRKKRKFSEHASSIGSDEQNLDIPKQLKSSEQCLVPGVSWLVLKRPSSRIAQWREAHGIPRGSRTSAEAKRKWRLKRKEANIPVKRGGKTPAWSRIKYVAKVLAKEVAYLLREWMRQPGLKMKKPQANAGRYTFEGKLGSKLEKLARVWDSVPSSLQEELRGIAPLLQWH